MNLERWTPIMRATGLLLWELVGALCVLVGIPAGLYLLGVALGAGP